MQTKDAVSIEVAGLVYRYRNAVQTNRATSEFQDDITGNLIRQILGSFDGYQSRENAKQTVRAMQENARQGFCNGSVPHVRVRDDAAYRKEWAVPVLYVCGLCPGRYDHLSRAWYLHGGCGWVGAGTFGGSLVHPGAHEGYL